MTFDSTEFLTPLDPLVVLMALVLGAAFGMALRALGWGPKTGRVMFAAGIVFYIPLALLRGMEGSPVWERFLATLVLWTVFLVGMRIGRAVGRAQRR